jgi:hypothetical protein
MSALAKEELLNKLQIETTSLKDSKRLEKITNYHNRLICVKAWSNEHSRRYS